MSFQESKNMKRLDAQNKGLVDYDETYNILYFKAKEREYKTSIEVGDLMLDIDAEGFVTGLQIFDAAERFSMPKKALQKIVQWILKSRSEDGVITAQLTFKANFNGKLAEKSLDIVCAANDVEDAESICTNTPDNSD